MKQVTKEELVAFANDFYKDNYVVTYKRQGTDENIAKVENPGITPVNLNRDKQSDYLVAFNQIEPAEITPVFVDFEKEIKHTKLANNLEVASIENKVNDLFQMNFILIL